MLKCKWIAALTGLLLLAGCHADRSGETPPRELKFFYAEDELPRGVYRELRRDEVAGEDDFFGDSNQALFRAIRRRAAELQADAVVIGETHRADCACAACRSRAAQGHGSTTFAKVVFLGKKPASE